MHQRIADVLSEHNAVYKLRLHSEYHQPITSPQDFAQALGYNISRITKTLFLRSSSGDIFCLAVASMNRRIDLGKIATALSVARVQMGSKNELKQTLDYPSTGVSPLGCGEISVFMDATLFEQETILIGGGVIGEEIEITPATLAKLCNARVLSLSE